ncbi:MAG TPA: lipoprotein-releasing ABC transporter permease subunit [Stellaceae bacterium]|nr:lipoprotein-releasing ABC transporter permease subunit [Stellaceae bacterium]
MAFGAFERMVAFRYLRARRQEGFISVVSWFSLIGILLGVMALIITLAIFNGFREQLIDRILGLNGHVTIINRAARIADYDALAAAVAKVPGVVSAVPLVDSQAIVTARNTSTGAIVRGMKQDDLKRLGLFGGSKLAAGSLDDFSGDSVAIGYRLASRLGVTVGGQLSLITPEGSATAFGTVPRIKSCRVVAIFNVGMLEYDNGYVYMPLDAAQLYFRLPEAVSEIEVRLDNPERAEALAPTIQRAVGLDFRAIPWQQLNSSFFNFVALQRNLYAIVVTLIILVAAFNIISGLIMLVREKARGIAILRTMGATRGMILRIFFLGGMTIGAIGTLTGLVLGLLFCHNIEAIHQWLERTTGQNLFPAEFFYLTQLPAVVDPREVAVVVVMSLGLSFLASIYPAWRAARVDPVEALRYE